jgi:hypothetical protein
LACRHHVFELHLKYVMIDRTGQTTDPGVPLFRRLKARWYEVVDTIDYNNLVTLDLNDFPEWMRETAQSVLTFLEELLVKNTFPRADYQEFHQLAVVCLGGTITGFRFRLPGPDHHARWQSKAIYSLKLFLLSNLFHMTEEEILQVKEISIFVLLFYICPWFEASLATCAARNDLTLMANMIRSCLI